MNWEYVWDSIYSSAGEVQKDVLPTVIALTALNERNSANCSE